MLCLLMKSASSILFALKEQAFQVAMTNGLVPILTNKGSHRSQLISSGFAGALDDEYLRHYEDQLVIGEQRIITRG